MNDQESFAQLIEALSPWREQLILIGGWCHRLHRLHPLAQAQDYPVVHTRDTDLLIQRRPGAGEDILGELKRLGFKEVFSGDQKPPATHYYLGDEGTGFYAEFLLPWAAKRVETPTETVGGVVAQQVKRVDVLLVDPWIVRIDDTEDLKLAKPTDLYIANPLCFLVQKFLIKQDRRSNEKKAQDLLYVYDTLQVFSHMFEEFKTSWQEVISPALSAKSIATIHEEWLRSAEEEDEIADMAAAIASGRNPSVDAAQIQSVLRYAYSEITGSP